MQLFSARAQAQEQERQLLEVMRGGNCCGGIIWSLLSAERLERVMPHRPLHWPMVFIEVKHDPKANGYGDVVIFNGFGTARQLAGAYLRRGGRRLIFFSTVSRIGNQTVQMRLRGLRRAIEEMGPEADIDRDVQVILCADDGGDIDLGLLLDRQDEALLVAATNAEVGLLQAAAQGSEATLHRLAPAVGFGLTSYGPRWSLPQVLFSPSRLAQEAVAALARRRLMGDGHWQQVLIHGEQAGSLLPA